MSERASTTEAVDPYAITRRQLETLRDARSSRVRPFGCIVAPFFGILLISGVSFWGQATAVAWSCWAAALCVLSMPWLGWRRYMRTFNGAARPHGRIECPIEGGAPLLYRTTRDDRANERLILPLDAPGLAVGPDLPPILDPAFDQAIGLKGTDVQRTLLGPILRGHAADWHARYWFVIDGDGARVRLGGKWLDPHDTDLQTISAAVGAYRQRLSEPAFAALGRMARDLAQPFDAARALALLGRDWSTQQASLSRDLDAQPLGRLINRIALTGEGLDAPALSWPQRSAIGRGILGIKCPARTRLLRTIERLDPEDGVAAMGVVELTEAAGRIAPPERFAAARAGALAILEALGGPECLDWLRARARRDASQRALLNAVSTRLQTLTSGYLSLGAEESSGGLSETAAGAVALADDES